MQKRLPAIEAATERLVKQPLSFFSDNETSGRIGRCNLPAMLQPWRTGKIIRIQPETDTTRRFWLEVPELDRFDFKPGQFVTLDLPIHEKPNKRWRSYSIASWPDGTNVFELVVVHLKEGAGSGYLFNEVTIGSEIKFRGPQGTFVLPESIDQDIYLICTGTGVAPFRSMVQHIKTQAIPHKNIHLVFGTRHQSDILYYQEFIQLQQQLPGFFYHPVLSREDWQGLKGYVHDVYEQLCRQNNTAETPEPARFYLCGWKNMVDEAKERILQMGYDRKSIHLELYG